MVALLAILIIGVPHGAADAQLAARAHLATDAPGMAAWTAGYVGLAAAFVGLWMLLPLLALPVFFLMSAYHFGRSDALVHGVADTASLRAWAHGGCLFLLPLWHAEATDPVFALLSGLQPDLLHPFFLCGGMAWAVFTATMALRQQISRSALVEIAAIAAMFLLLPPLPAFALYFVGVHSARHFRKLFARILTGPRARQMFVLMSAVSIALFGMATVAFDATDFNDGLTKAIFIGLAGLTVPHMLLIDGLSAFERVPSEGAGHD